jgi:hypothetical protein
VTAFPRSALISGACTGRTRLRWGWRCWPKYRSSLKQRPRRGCQLGEGDSFTGWPLDPEWLPSTLAILDLIEFCFRHVAEPLQGEYHGFFSHHHLNFQQDEGRLRWREDMHAVLARNGLAYEITGNGTVIRLGTAVETERVRQAVFATGDAQLDELLDVSTEHSDTLLYLDPPYYVKGGGLYQNYYSHQDHAKIAALVSELPFPWLVSYDAARR